MSDAVTRARELLSKATPGPWYSAKITRPRGANFYTTPSGTAGMFIEAQTCSAADAELIAAAPTLLAELADEVERLRALATVDDAMVETAADALDMAISDGHFTAMRHMRAALEAALGVKS